jgi:hypothetical protein
MQACLPAAERWRMRWRTGAAMALLGAARLAVAVVPFRLWRGSLGLATDRLPGPDEQTEAVRLARHVERAAMRLPFATRCLPRAMALSWLLRRADVAHAVIFAVRPAPLRADGDALHAWVEVAGSCILGDLPGPWHVTLRLGDAARN